MVHNLTHWINGSTTTVLNKTYRCAFSSTSSGNVIEVPADIGRHSRMTPFLYY